MTEVQERGETAGNGGAYLLILHKKQRNDGKMLSWGTWKIREFLVQFQRPVEKLLYVRDKKEIL